LGSALKLNSSDSEAKLSVLFNYDELSLLATAVSIAHEHLVDKFPNLEDEMILLAKNLHEMNDHLSSLIDRYFE